jgi:hypothetical protein
VRRAVLLALALVTVLAALARPPRCVRCGSGRIEVALALGDRDDRLAVSTAPAGAPELLPTVDAGDGNDVVIAPGILGGGPGDDQLTGSAGDDGLAGGPGNDMLVGLGGDDTMAGDAEPQDGTDGSPYGDDVLDGGAGHDGIVYAARHRPVTIDLSAGTAGEAGADARPSLIHGMVVVRAWLTCACTYIGTLTVRRGGKLLASGRVRIRPGSPERPHRTLLRAPLTTVGVRVFARRVTATVSFKSQISAAQGYRARLGG